MKKMSCDYTTDDLIKFICKYNIATLATNGEAWPNQIATIFYATNDGSTLYAKFHILSDHGRAISRDKRVSLSIYNHNSTYHEKYGVQLRGHCYRVSDESELRSAIDIYSNTFNGARERFDPVDVLLSDKAVSTLFRIDILSGKIVTPKGHMPHYSDLININTSDSF